MKTKRQILRENSILLVVLAIIAIFDIYGVVFHGVLLPFNTLINLAALLFLFGKERTYVVLIGGNCLAIIDATLFRRIPFDSYIIQGITFSVIGAVTSLAHFLYYKYKTPTADENKNTLTLIKRILIDKQDVQSKLLRSFTICVTSIMLIFEIVLFFWNDYIFIFFGGLPVLILLSNFFILSSKLKKWKNLLAFSLFISALLTFSKCYFFIMMSFILLISV
ncbi:MAG: hypothetical protein IPM74_01235 [Crocinitomicaceae bacterium]|nr:hypothetical protein [Crocinitomicaceae bacterium]